MDPILPRSHGQQHPEHEPVEATQAPKLRKQRPKKRVLPAVVVGIVLLLAGGAAAWVFWLRTPDNIPGNIRKSVAFPLYQPTHLPSGFALDKTSFNSSQQVVTFTINYNGGKKLIFIEQPKPTQLNFSDFTQQLSNAQSITLPIGQAAIGTYQGVGLGTIAGDQTWVLIRAPGGIDSYNFEAIIHSMK